MKAIVLIPLGQNPRFKGVIIQGERERESVCVCVSEPACMCVGVCVRA